MAGESVESLLRSLTTQAGDTQAETYARWASLSLTDPSLEELVRRKLVATSHTANQEESLEATVRKGGGTGESITQMLLKTGLTGLS